MKLNTFFHDNYFFKYAGKSIIKALLTHPYYNDKELIFPITINKGQFSNRDIRIENLNTKGNLLKHYILNGVFKETTTNRFDIDLKSETQDVKSELDVRWSILNSLGQELSYKSSKSLKETLNIGKVGTYTVRVQLSHKHYEPNTFTKDFTVVKPTFKDLGLSFNYSIIDEANVNKARQQGNPPCSVTRNCYPTLLEIQIGKKYSFKVTNNNNNLFRKIANKGGDITYTLEYDKNKLREKYHVLKNIFLESCGNQNIRLKVSHPYIKDLYILNQTFKPSKKGINIYTFYINKNVKDIKIGIPVKFTLKTNHTYMPSDALNDYTITWTINGKKYPSKKGKTECEHTFTSVGDKDVSIELKDNCKYANYTYYRKGSNRGFKVYKSTFPGSFSIVRKGNAPSYLTTSSYKLSNKQMGQIYSPNLAKVRWTFPGKGYSGCHGNKPTYTYETSINEQVSHNFFYVAGSNKITAQIIHPGYNLKTLTQNISYETSSATADGIKNYINMTGKSCNGDDMCFNLYTVGCIGNNLIPSDTKVSWSYRFYNSAYGKWTTRSLGRPTLLREHISRKNYKSGTAFSIYVTATIWTKEKGITKENVKIEKYFFISER